jgi:hypothetical protein
MAGGVEDDRSCRDMIMHGVERARLSPHHSSQRGTNMKKAPFLLIVLFTLLLAPSSSATQRYVGVVGGVNFADLTAKLTTGAELETNLHVLFGAGAVFGFELRENVFLQLEPKYIRKGAKLLFEEPEEPSPDYPWSPYYDFQFSLVEVPALFRIVFGEQIKRYAFFGPSFGFLLKSELEVEFDEVTYTADIKEITKNIDFGLIFGTGVSLPVGRGQIFIDGRYAAGFANLSKGGQIDFKNGNDIVSINATTRKISTKGFQLMVGYTIPLGG